MLGLLTPPPKKKNLPSEFYHTVQQDESSEYL